MKYTQEEGICLLEIAESITGVLQVINSEHKNDKRYCWCSSSNKYMRTLGAECIIERYIIVKGIEQYKQGCAWMI